jgi:hypothetical protein
MRAPATAFVDPRVISSNTPRDVNASFRSMACAKMLALADIA